MRFLALRARNDNIFGRYAVTAAALMFMLLAPLGAAAADPQTNPTCWTGNQCRAAGGHFEAGRGECVGSVWGHCYVQRPIDIQVHIPGLEGKQVRDLAQYIQVVYAWGVRAAAIAAVIAIMVGGLMWLTSGGAERLGKAKELIGNAVIGLLLALFSFVILKTVNPDLVRLSLPRTMMLRAVPVGSQYCSGVSADIPIREGGADGAIVGESSRGTLRCGNVYHTPTALAKTCVGDTCDPGQVCMAQDASRFGCTAAMIAGTVTGDGEAYLDGPVELAVVCQDEVGRLAHHRLYKTSEKKILDARQHTYAFERRSFETVRQAVMNECDVTSTADARVWGFVLIPEVNAGTFGDYDFAVGPSACGGASRPIKVGTVTDPDNIPWSQVPLTDLFRPDAILNVAVDPGRVLTCNMAMNRSDFPDRR